MPLIVSVVRSLLVSVTVWAALVVPTGWALKLRLVGDRVTTAFLALVVPTTALPNPRLVVERETL